MIEFVKYDSDCRIEVQIHGCVLRHKLPSSLPCGSEMEPPEK